MMVHRQFRSCVISFPTSLVEAYQLNGDFDRRIFNDLNKFPSCLSHRSLLPSSSHSAPSSSSIASSSSTTPVLQTHYTRSLANPISSRGENYAITLPVRCRVMGGNKRHKWMNRVSQTFMQAIVLLTSLIVTAFCGIPTLG